MSEYVYCFLVILGLGIMEYFSMRLKRALRHPQRK